MTIDFQALADLRADNPITGHRAAGGVDLRLPEGAATVLACIRLLASEITAGGSSAPITGWPAITCFGDPVLDGENRQVTIDDLVGLVVVLRTTITDPDTPAVASVLDVTTNGIFDADDAGNHSRRLAIGAARQATMIILSDSLGTLSSGDSIILSKISGSDFEVSLYLLGRPTP